MIICVRCNEKPADMSRPNWCRPCKRQYDRDYWAKTKEKRNTKKRKNSATIRKRNRQFVWDYLLTHHCIDCGEKNPIVLQFDHYKDKEYNISNMVTLSLEKLIKEIAKCEVRCANCHIIKTSKDFNWYEEIQRDIA